MNNYIEKFKRGVKGKVFISIDAANLERSVQSMWVNPKDITDTLKSYNAEELCWKVDYQKLENFFKNVRSSQKIRFYSAEFQTESHNKFLSFLKKALSFKLKTKPLKEYEDHTA